MYPLQSIRGGDAASIAACIEDAVAAGELTAGTRLPTIREVAEHLDLANGTVARAYAILRERGIVETQGRRGTLVRRASILAPRRTAMPVPEGAIDCANGDPRLQPDATEALRAAAAAPTGYEVLDNPTVLPQLQELLDAAAAGEGVDTSHSLVVPGTMYGIELGLGAHLRPGDRVAVEDPAWSDHLDLFTSMGLHVDPVPVDDFGMDPERLAGVVDRVDAVVLTPRAQSPTGAAMDRTRREQLAELLRGRDLLVVEDDHAADIAGVDLHAMATDPVTEHWLIVRSLSKAWGPDLRLGAVYGDQHTVRRMHGRMRLGPGWVSRWLQATAVHLLTSDQARETVASARDLLARKRAVFLAALDDHGVTGHGRSGVNVWVPVSDEATVVAGLLARGWVVAPGARFRQQAGPGIRITIAQVSDEGLGDLAAAIAETIHGRAIHAA